MIDYYTARPGLVRLAALLLLAPAAGPLVADTTLRLDAGYRIDDLDWNIADPSGSPNVLSELTWRDMKIFQVKADISGSNADHVYVRASAGLGWALDGENQDSDYAGDNRSLEFSRTINATDDSSVADFSAGFGYELHFGEQDRHSLIPMLGYSLHYQFLRMTDGNQVVWNQTYAQLYDPTISPNPLGPFSGLDSSYDARWWGPWLGLDLLLDFQGRGNAFARIEYHLVDYNGQANWNLRDDFAHPLSFEHTADGKGWVMELGWRKPLASSGWLIGATVNMQDWRTEAGTDTVYYDGGGVAETPLNEVNWISKSINLTLSRKLN